MVGKPVDTKSTARNYIQQQLFRVDITCERLYSTILVFVITDTKKIF